MNFVSSDYLAVVDYILNLNLTLVLFEITLVTKQTPLENTDRQTDILLLFFFYNNRIL